MTLAHFDLVLAAVRAAGRKCPVCGMINALCWQFRRHRRQGRQSVREGSLNATWVKDWTKSM